MTESIKLSKKDEYFVAVAKQGRHSFMMLGVIKEGVPISLQEWQKQTI